MSELLERSEKLLAHSVLDSYLQISKTSAHIKLLQIAALPGHFLFSLIPVDQHPASTMGQGFGSVDPGCGPLTPPQENPQTGTAGIDLAAAPAPSGTNPYIPAHRDPGYEALVYRCKLELQAERKKADQFLSPSCTETSGNNPA